MRWGNECYGKIKKNRHSEEHKDTLTVEFEPEAFIYKPFAEGNIQEVVSAAIEKKTAKKAAS